LSDWRSYDEIASAYDRVWATRFEAVAREMARMMPRCALETTLDIGTGTGIVPAIFAEVFKKPGVNIGCDVSRRMLRQAKARLPRLHVVVADAAALPFQSETFDVSTASFVLSHIRDYRKALQDVHWVLKTSGLLAVSNWVSTVDEYSQAWSSCLADAISKAETERALQEIAPCENYFAEKGNLEAALSESGFSIVHSGTVDLSLKLTIEQYVEDREINSAGRLGRHLLGNDKWTKFREKAANVLRARFGNSIPYSRQALIVIGKKER